MKRGLTRGSFGFRVGARGLRVVAALALAAGLVACGGDAPGGGTSGGSTGPSTVTSIELTTSRSSIAARAGESVDVTVTALDSSRRVVSGVSVVMSADSGVLTNGTGATDSTGKRVAKFELGQDRSNRTVTINATAGGTAASATIQVTGTTLTLSSNAGSIVTGPDAVAQLSARLVDAASEPISGAAVVFGTDQGTLSATTAITDAGGFATTAISGITSVANISAKSGTTEGTVTIRASGQTTVTLEPAGVVVTDFIVQANPAVTGPNQPGNSGNFSAIEVRVTGSVGTTNNVQVRNAPVKFRIATAPPFGVLEIDTSANPVLSNEIGLATNRYIPGAGTSGTDAIVVCASVTGLATPATSGLDFPGNPCTANEKPVRLTVAQQALFVKISTDNTIEKTDGGLTYTKKFTVNVTDAAGRGVPGVVITPRLLPLYYRKGYYEFGAEAWVKAADVRCTNEDTNFNGILDSQDNNENNDSFVWPGQVAAISVANNGVTDGTGFVILSVKYGQSFGTWADYQIEARAAVGGTEGVAQYNYLLDVATTDVKNKESAPGFQVSPFGIAMTCANPS